MIKQLLIGPLLRAVTGLMAIALVATFAVIAVFAYERMRTADRVLVSADVSRDLFMAMQALMVERGSENTALLIPKPIDTQTAGTIAALRGRSEQSLNAALARLSDSNLPGTGAAVAAIRANHDHYTDLRRQADAAVRQPFDQRPRGLAATWVADGGKLVDALNALSDVLAANVAHADTFIAEMMKMKQLGWTMRDAGGLDRLVLGGAVAKQSLLPEMREQTVALSGQVDAAWRTIQDDARLQSLPPALNNAIALAKSSYFGTVRANHKLIVEALAAGQSTGAAGVQWIDARNDFLAPLINVANTAFDLTADHADTAAVAARRDFAIAVLLMLFFVGFGVFAIRLVDRRVVRPMAVVTGAVRAVAEGDLAGRIPYARRHDEIGDLARALVVFRDNAIEKQRMAEELVRTERLSTLGQLTATVAHELRNPLSAIRNTYYVMKEAASRKETNFDRQLDRMERSIGRCDRIISDLLDYSRLRTLNRSPVIFDQWIDEVLSDQHLPDDVRLIKRLDGAGATIGIDVDRMRQVVNNLVENAAQAMHGSDSGNVREIVVSTAVAADACELTVSDTGPGIPASVLPKVFEPLFSTKSFGTGLGLSVVRQIVGQHGGTVTITSDPEKGACVAIRLPHRAATELAA
ncbi:MAG TPA: ATP-binding protein [Stellaceae bacterium]|nr:ATP-binding protein [Stellaceae bacterium]